MRILTKKTHKTTTLQIITTMIILDIPEDSVAVGILVTSTSSVVVSASSVVMIFRDCVVETSKVSLPSVELPFSATGTSGTRILKCSLSLKHLYFMGKEEFPYKSNEHSVTFQQCCLFITS